MEGKIKTMKKEYFGLLGGSTQPNNKLQKQVWKYFQSLSKTGDQGPHLLFTLHEVKD